jgi:N-acylneuraminate cytidylyltransferase
MIALLPMKGHSQRIPNKNIKKILNKPLFFFIADKLKKVEKFDSLVINTDSKIISELARERYGSWVKIINRPKHLQGDSISMNSIIEHDISILGADNHFFQTHSTNPLLKKSSIINSVNEYLSFFKKDKIDSLFSVTSMKKRLYDSNFKPLNHEPGELIQTQNLRKIYEENSNFYIFSGDSFLKNNHRIGINSKMYVMDSNSFESLDIDEKNDWVLAEMLLKRI